MYHGESRTYLPDAKNVMCNLSCCNGLRSSLGGTALNYRIGLYHVFHSIRYLKNISTLIKTVTM